MQLSQRLDAAAMLATGGDRRIAIDPATGRNRYLCPAIPDPGLICFASCTASPISPHGFKAAQLCLERIGGGDAAALSTETTRTARRILGYFGLNDVAEILLAPSGTDATLLLMGLLAAERPGVPMVSILPAAAETGSGVPNAAAGCHFAHITARGETVIPGTPLAGFSPDNRVITVALRDADGGVRTDLAINRAFATAARSAHSVSRLHRPVVHLIDGSKTGITAPRQVPGGTDVIVDACQSRLDGDRLRDYLAQGWPVLITGSKFYGGPAFAGAVLFPKPRWAAIKLARLPNGLAAYGAGNVNAGTLLRWNAALAEMERFAACPPALAAQRMQTLGDSITRRAAALECLVPIASSPPHGGAWHQQQSIFSFAIRDPEHRDRLLSMAELRRIHRDLAAGGVLIGQPVEITGTHGALRVAVGARNMMDPDAEAALDRMFGALEREVMAGCSHRVEILVN